jgi:hypothetical protein
MIVGITIAIAPGNQGLIILAPLIALVGILILFLGRLTREDGRLPIADIGSFYVLAIFAYGAIPLLFHLLSGMQLTVLSHDRLLSLDPPPIEYALVGWLHVVFMATFVLTYISIRKANPFLEGKALVVTKNTLKVLLLMWLMFEGYFLYLKLFMGINFSTAYDSSLYESAAAYAQLGTTQQQFVAHPLGMLSAIKIGLIIWLTSKWKSRAHRLMLIAVLVYILWGYLKAPGGRFAIISIFLTVMLTYHQLVQPIRFRKTLFYGFLLLITFFAANIYRGQDTGNVGLAFDFIKETSGGGSGLFSFSNEFQISYGSIMELENNLYKNFLGSIPWQVYFHDIFLLVPNQLLPFEKIDPVLWYVKATNNPDFFNYGVIARSIIGFGLVEVILFGLIMGGILASIHNWYIRHCGSFWHTFLYIWIAIVVYQSFRNVSTYVAPLFLYQWLPVYLLASFLVWVLPKRSSPNPSSVSVGFCRAMI